MNVDIELFHSDVSSFDEGNSNVRNDCWIIFNVANVIS